MGITKHTYNLINKYLTPNCSILELGSQNIYFGNEYGMFAKPHYQLRGHNHVSVDLNGEGGSLVKDLTKPLSLGEFDIVTNAGTSEHTNDLYMCYKNMWNSCKEGGYIVSENPKTGNWKDHGNFYLTLDFYKQFPNVIEYGEHPAMHNTTDGWNIYGVVQRKGKFMTRKEFDKLDYRPE